MRASLSLTRRYFQNNSLKVSADRCAMRLERLEFAHITCATLWRALAMSLWSPDRQLYLHSFGIRRRSLGMHPINPLAVALDCESARFNHRRRNLATVGRGQPRRGKDDDVLSPISDRGRDRLAEGPCGLTPGPASSARCYAKGSSLNG